MKVRGGCPCVMCGERFNARALVGLSAVSTFLYRVLAGADLFHCLVWRGAAASFWVVEPPFHPVCTHDEAGDNANNWTP